VTIDPPLGNLYMQTFKKLPTESPNRKIKMEDISSGNLALV